MFGNQVLRLLREDWRTATELAQELYAMFNDKTPLSHDAPITLGRPDGSTQNYLTLRNYGDGGIIMDLKRGGGEDYGTISIDGSDLVFTPAGGSPSSGGGSNRQQQTATSVFAGRIGSGSDSSYQMTVFPQGLGAAGVEVTVTQLQSEEGETLAIGTWALVAKLRDNSHVMQAQRAMVFPGKVASGSGTTYQVDIYPTNVTGVARRVTVSQLQADSGEVIGVGTWVVVLRSNDGSYYMQAQRAAAMPGKIISGGGSTYQVDVYPSGTGNSPTRVSVTQLQLASGETIPANTWAIVARTSDGSYYMQVPVYLE